MSLFEASLMVATYLCSLVAGLLFAFAVVIMPGIRSLDDGAFIRAFQTIDRIIQNNQSLFIIVWVGSVIAVIETTVVAIWTLPGANHLLIIVAAIVYLLAVQAPTIAINVPLNNQLQRLDVATMSEATLQHARGAFETRWNRWNAIRSVGASVVAILLMLVLLRV